MFAVSALGIQNVNAQNNDTKDPKAKKEASKVVKKKQPAAEVATTKGQDKDAQKPQNNVSKKAAENQATPPPAVKDAQRPQGKVSAKNKTSEPKVRTAKPSENTGTLQAEKKKKNETPETKPKMRKETTMKKNNTSSNVNTNAQPDNAVKPKPKMKKEAGTNNQSGTTTK